MSDPSLEDLERRLETLPREAWDRPMPPRAPWPDEETAARPRRRDRLVLRPLAAVAASLLLVAAGIGGGLLLAGDEDTAPSAGPARVQLEPVGAAASGAGGVVRLDPQAGGTASVELSGLRPSRGDDFYELWLLGRRGELVSLGSVRVPESGSATLNDVPLPVDPRRFDYLDVSREPGDGDPGHSSVSVLRGPAA